MRDFGEDDRAGSDDVRFAAPDLVRFAIWLLSNVGVPEDTAEVVAESLVESNLRGHDSHGIRLLEPYVDRVLTGQIHPHAEQRRDIDLPAMAIIDGRNNFGQVVARAGMMLGIEKARETGVSCVGMRNADHMGRLGAYVEMAAEAGLAAIAMANSGGYGRIQAPFGSREGRFGTNPLAVGVPNEPHPIVVDFATSAMAAGKVRRYRDLGTPLPPDSVLDPHGRPTCDAADFFDPDTDSPVGTILPLGGTQGHKGYGLAFTVEVFAGIFAGAGFAGSHVDVERHGAFFIVVDISRLKAPDQLAAELRELVDFVKSAKPLAEGGLVMIPGEPEHLVTVRRRTSGIPLDAVTCQRLRRLATAHGLKFPSPV